MGRLGRSSGPRQGSCFTGTAHSVCPAKCPPKVWIRCCLGPQMLAISFESFARFLRDNAMSVAARELRKTCCVLGSIMAAARPRAVFALRALMPALGVRQLSGANCECNGRVWRMDVGMSSGVLNAIPQVRAQLMVSYVQASWCCSCHPSATPHACHMKLLAPEHICRSCHPEALHMRQALGNVACPVSE